MSKAVPWSIKGVDFDVREAAKDAARRDGLTLGEWMNRAIADRAAEIGVSEQEFDADERLEAIAAQLARLSREAEDEAAPRRRGEPIRRAPRDSAVEDRALELEWGEDALRERAARRAAAAGRQASRDFFARSGARVAAEPEALEDRPRPRPARAAPSPRGEKLGDRLSDIERKLHRDESEAAAPLRGLIASVHDRLGEMESRLVKRDRLADDRPLRGALERLETRIDAMASRSEPSVDDALLRQLDGRLGAILSRLERVETTPPGAARDEQFARLEKRIDALMTRVERPAPAPRRGLADAVAEIAERQRDLDSDAARPSRPPAQLTAMLDERFEALARKFDLAAAKSLSASTVPAQAERARIDQLQNGIQALSGRIEDMRRDFAESGADSRAALEALARDLHGRVESALAAPTNAGVAGLNDLRRDIAALTRSLNEVAPRTAVVGLETALRDLAGRVDSAREAMVRAASVRVEAATPAEVEALGRQVAAMSQTLADLAPRSQVASLEGAVRALTARIERSRDEGVREAVLGPIETLAEDVRRAMAESGASANFDGVSRQLFELEDKVEQLRQTGGADRSDFLQVYDQSEQIRAMIAQAMEKMAPIERLERKVAELSEKFDAVARQAQAAGPAPVALPWAEIEARLNDLATRIDRAAPAAIDDSRYDDLTRRIDLLHDAFAARGEVRGEASDHAALEPLLRALSDRLDAEPVAGIGAEAIQSLERRIADISKRLERGETEAERRLQRVVEQIAERLDFAREPLHDDRNARELADLREKTEASDRRAQQTLSAVHETLEKVVDRLAMIEEDVIEARGAAEAATQAPVPPAPRAEARRLDPQVDDFLREPGEGRPVAGPLAARRDEGDDAVDLDDALLDSAVARARDRAESEDQDAEASGAQTNYIDVARRALAARLAAEAAEQADAKKKSKSELKSTAKAEASEKSASRFVRPDRERKKSSGVGMPVILFTAVGALSFGVYQAYRLLDAPAAPMQAVNIPSVEKARPAETRPAEAAPARQAEAPAAKAAAPAPEQPASAAPAAPVTLSPMAPAIIAPGPSSSVAPSAAPSATLNSAPIVPGNVLAPKPVRSVDAAKGAGLPDPLATGSIAAGRPNTLSAVQANALVQQVKDLAEKGDAAAQFEYGARLAEGRGVDQDKAAAISWFDKAAAQGLAQAEYRLGAIYEKGAGAPRDPLKARDFYEKAASQGNVRAMHNLAVILAEGVDGKPDYAGAAQWFQRAAEYGVRDSQFNLAILYARGMGVPQNLGQSYMWFGIAALQGDEDAARKRDEVGAQLGDAALATAKKQVADFHARAPLAAVNEPPPITAGAGASAASARKVVSKI
jgi:localization factor PodJL